MGCPQPLQGEHRRDDWPDFYSHLVPVGRKFIRLQIWDMVGQEKSKDNSRAYFQNTVCAVFISDLMDLSPFYIHVQVARRTAELLRPERLHSRRPKGKGESADPFTIKLPTTIVHKGKQTVPSNEQCLNISTILFFQSH
jgi:hypothetical protein